MEVAAVDRVFARIEELLSKGWTQRAFARDEDGQPRPTTSPEAVCWCASGAVWQAINELVAGTGWRDPARLEANDAVRRALYRALARRPGFEVGVPLHHWNDAEGRTQAEVLELVREARALAALAAGAAP